MAVNSSPELEGIERVTKVDVAGKIFQFLERRLAARQAKESRPGRRSLQLAAVT